MVVLALTWVSAHGDDGKGDGVLLLKAGGGVGPPKVTSSSPTWTSPPPSPASSSPACGLLGKQDSCLLISYFFLQLNRGINL